MIYEWRHAMTVLCRNSTIVLSKATQIWYVCQFRIESSAVFFFFSLPIAGVANPITFMDPEIQLR